MIAVDNGGLDPCRECHGIGRDRDGTDETHIGSKTFNKGCNIARVQNDVRILGQHQIVCGVANRRPDVVEFGACGAPTARDHDSGQDVRKPLPDLARGGQCRRIGLRRCNENFKRLVILREQRLLRFGESEMKLLDRNDGGQRGMAIGKTRITAP